jgi:hypothetical protein
MKMEQNEGVAPGGAHVSNNHSWGSPPPGSGTLMVCTQCGEKKTHFTDRAECVGRPATGLAETVHDYDPIG